MLKRLLLVSITMFSCVLFVAGQKSIQEVESILQQKSKEYGLTIADINDFEITHQHTSQQSGIQHIYIRQRYQGIPIYLATGSIHLNQDKELIKMNLSFHPYLKKKIEEPTEELLTAIQAIEAVSKALNYKIRSSPTILEKTNNQQVLSAPDISQEAIPVQLMYYVDKDGNFSQVWDCSILELDGQNWWSIRVDAMTGEIIDKVNWVVNCTYESLNAVDGSNNAIHQHHPSCLEKNHQHRIAPMSKSASLAPDSYRVFALGIESPNHGARTLEVNPADANASPFGWHDDNGSTGAEYNITRGNNVYAQEDVNGDDGTGTSPNGTASLDFDYPLNLSNSPLTTDNQNSAITNLFYWNNIMHDVWYQYGFDEASGNFQEHNYGNGGVGNDYVLADGQDGAGINNATFGTPPDGGNPRMQMFFWDPGNTTPLQVNSPTSIAGNYTMLTGSFGPQVYNVTGNLVIANDGTTAPSEACNALTNGTAMNGNIALIDRANCNFTVKVKNAQNAGAIAVIVCNNVAGGVFSMGGTDNTITIPSVMVSQADCATIRTQIPTVNVTMVSTTAPLLDVDFDNGIIAHEYGHGISTRLTGGASNANCLSDNEQMGEGWSDFFALMMTTDASDAGTDSRGVGTYVIGQTTTGGGIRTYPYSTNFAINPHTYDDIGSESIPHGVGAVWCAMLWEMTWELVNVYGWDNDYYYGTGGNNIAMALVVEGLKLQPCNPGFVDGRDAILAADKVLYDGANTCYIWEAFARRGLGYSADQGTPSSVTDGTEAFDIPASALDFTKTTSVSTISVCREITYTLTLNNPNDSCAIAQNNLIIMDDLPANTTFVNATNGGTLTGNTVSFPNLSLAVGQSDTVSITVSVNNSIGGPSTFVDDVESGNTIWTATATAPSLGNWATTTTNANSSNNSWFAPDVDEPDDQYLTSQFIIPTTTSELSFWHSFDTEVNWDGGRVEYSTDGTTWIDLGNWMTQNPYNDRLDDNPATPGFSGDSGGFIETKIDLSALANQCIQVRFFMHCDPAVGGVGWYIDDISFTNLETIIENTAFVEQNGIEVATVSAKPTIIQPATACRSVQIRIVKND